MEAGCASLQYVLGTGEMLPKLCGPWRGCLEKLCGGPAAALAALAVASLVMGYRAFFIIRSPSDAELSAILLI